MRTDTYYQVEEILHHVYRISSNEGTFLYLFIGDEKALLLDTGYGFGDLKTTVKKMTDLPLIIVNSHGHLDHVCGNFQFDEDIFIHAEDIELCKTHNSTQSRQKIINGARQMKDFMSGQIRDALPDDFSGENYIQRGYGNLVPFKTDHMFELGNVTLVVHELPGHTSGSVGLEYKEQGALFPTDAINPLMFLFLPESTDLNTYKNSLRKASNLDINKVVFSHSQQIASKSILDDFIECAEQADYERGIPFEAPAGQEFEPRMCVRKGFDPEDTMAPGFAAVIIGRSQL